MREQSWRTFSASGQGFSIDGAKVAPYYTDTIEDNSMSVRSIEDYAMWRYA